MVNVTVKIGDPSGPTTARGPASLSQSASIPDPATGKGPSAVPHLEPLAALMIPHGHEHAAPAPGWQHGHMP